MNVQELHEALGARNPSLTQAEMADLVWRLAEQGKADLEDIPPTAGSLTEYLRFWERNLWLYVSLAISFATVLVIYVMPSEFPFVIVRWVLLQLLSGRFFSPRDPLYRVESFIE